MTISAFAILITSLIVLAVLTAALWAYSTANRLDRLHVRTDLSWQALDGALARRAVVARSVAEATTGTDAIRAKRLATQADQAERADRDQREAVENQLSASLSAVDIALLRPQLVSELADAEARVLLARRFHNDAVRDTLALRSRPLVRTLHLGGTAPRPRYFEISERADPAGATGLRIDASRTAARVVLLDKDGRLLLMRGHDPLVPGVTFWFTIGGGVEPGENLREAAVREVYEETGKTINAAQLRGPMWRRVAVFPFNGKLIRAEELFFVIEMPAFEPKSINFTELERQTITGHKWCTAADIVALNEAGEQVYPEGLEDLLAEARTVAAMLVEPEVRSIR